MLPPPLWGRLRLHRLWRIRTLHHEALEEPSPAERKRAFDIDVRSAAYHEGGHWLVGRYFNLLPVIHIEEAYLANYMTHRLVRARCGHDFTTSFRQCCIGWGGIVGDHIHLEGDTIPPFKEFSDELDWHYCHIELNDASQTDKAAICLMPSFVTS